MVNLHFFFILSWDLQWSTYNFGGTNKEYYGIFESGLRRCMHMIVGVFWHVLAQVKKHRVSNPCSGLKVLPMTSKVVYLHSRLPLTCSKRGKSCAQGAIGFGSHWLKNWCEIYKPISNRKACY